MKTKYSVMFVLISVGTTYLAVANTNITAGLNKLKIDVESEIKSIQVLIDTAPSNRASALSNLVASVESLVTKDLGERSRLGQEINSELEHRDASLEKAYALQTPTPALVYLKSDLFEALRRASEPVLKVSSSLRVIRFYLTWESEHLRSEIDLQTIITTIPDFSEFEGMATTFFKDALMKSKSDLEKTITEINSALEVYNKP